jgi:hypothetical protein
MIDSVERAARAAARRLAAEHGPGVFWPDACGS